MAEGNQDNLKTDYNPKEVFKQTYYISQGDIGLQRNLYNWLKFENIFKPSDFGSDIPDWVNNFHAPRLHSPKGKKGSEANDSKTEWNNFKAKISSQDSKHEENLPSKIIADLIKLDLDYQLRARPGRTGENSKIPDGAQDEHKSFTRHYVLNGNFMSKPFSDLFRQLKPALASIEQATPRELERISLPKPGESKESVRNWVRALTLEKKLGMLVKLWEQNHPGEKFFGN